MKKLKRNRRVRCSAWLARNGIQKVMTEYLPAGSPATESSYSGPVYYFDALASKKRNIVLLPLWKSQPAPKPQTENSTVGQQKRQPSETPGQKDARDSYRRLRANDKSSATPEQ